MNIRAVQKILSPLLMPLALPYRYIMQVRREKYRTGKTPSYRTSALTISIGNIAAGGTGKTPVTGWFLDWAAKNNLCAVVLTRGYGGTVGKEPVIVQQNTAPSVCGDEPLVLARNFPKATIIAHPKRILSAKIGESLSPDMFVLDDGMQHLAIRRDMNIVLLKEHDLYEGWDKVIPVGEWREGKAALQSADAFLIKTSSTTFGRIEQKAQELLASYKVPLFSFELFVKLVRDVAVGTVFAPHKQPYVLVAGVGEPGQVKETATQLFGQAPEEFYVFPDHHEYTQNEVATLTAKGLPILCTEKDAVKLEKYAPFSVQILAMIPQVQFGAYVFSSQGFTEWFTEWWEKV